MLLYYREFTRQLIVKDRIIENTYSVLAWRDNLDWHRSQQSVRSYKHKAILRFFRGKISSLKPLHIKSEEEKEFLNYVELVPATHWQVWKRVFEMVNAKQPTSDILTVLSAVAVARQLKGDES